MTSSEPHISIRTYAMIFASLLALLFISVAIAFIPTGEHRDLRDLLTLAGFTIAAIKGVLIILYFMHVRFNTRLTWIFASAAFVWFGLMVVGTLGDYLTRPDQPISAAPQIETRGEPQEHRPENGTGLYYKR